MACWRLSSTTIFTFSNCLMVNSIKENASKSMVVLKYSYFIVRKTLNIPFPTFFLADDRSKQLSCIQCMYPLLQAFAFELLEHYFRTVGLAQQSTTATKMKVQKILPFFLSSRELIFSLWEDRDSFPPFIGWRIGQDHTYIDGAICNFTT